eukprot:1176681-Prorocentrum_minimum.AAC.3
MRRFNEVFLTGDSTVSVCNRTQSDPCDPKPLVVLSHSGKTAAVHNGAHPREYVLPLPHTRVVRRARCCTTPFTQHRPRSVRCGRT